MPAPEANAELQLNLDVCRTNFTFLRILTCQTSNLISYVTLKLMSNNNFHNGINFISGYWASLSLGLGCYSDKMGGEGKVSTVKTGWFELED